MRTESKETEGMLEFWVEFDLWVVSAGKDLQVRALSYAFRKLGCRANNNVAS